MHQFFATDPTDGHVRVESGQQLHQLNGAECHARSDPVTAGDCKPDCQRTTVRRHQRIPERFHYC